MARALSGVGKERLQAWSSSPLSVTSFTPTMPIRSSDRSRASAASSGRRDTTTPGGNAVSSRDQGINLSGVSLFVFDNDGLLLDTEALGRVRATVGGGEIVVADLAEAATLGADMLVGGVLKWLCGGPGGAFLWVRPDVRPRLEPAPQVRCVTVDLVIVGAGPVGGAGVSKRPGW